MYGYEGIGCIYWHMIAKLLLAAQEAFEQAVAAGKSGALTTELRDHYLDIRAGLGFMKQPDVFGAFPLDPYSHTPGFAGAKQPGMTGQVKEEILTRWGELGVHIHDGKISFNPQLLRESEFLTEPTTFSYIDPESISQTLPLEAGSLAFTFCQVPIVYTLGDGPHIVISSSDGSEQRAGGSTLQQSVAREIFGRTGKIKQVTVHFPEIRCQLPNYRCNL
jgi:hypothetical protein